ncbi:hypothetical protein JCM10207_007098 [Rhodosporidiobolus poonsookiae]
MGVSYSQPAVPPGPPDGYDERTASPMIKQEQAERLDKAVEGTGVDALEHTDVQQKAPGVEQSLPTPSPSLDPAPASFVIKHEPESSPVPEPTSSPRLTEEALQALNQRTASQERPTDEDSLSSACSSIADAAVLPSSRRSVLFRPDKTFRSSSAFFASCNSRLQKAYGYTTWKYRSFDHYLVAVCAGHGSARCKFSVRVIKKDGQWVLEADRCRWEHSHDRGEGCNSTYELGSSSDEDSPEEDVESTPVAAHPPAPSRGGLKWSASTRSSAMLKLVSAREQVFAEQRKLDDAGLQARSQQLVDVHLAGSSNNVVPGSFRRYQLFCQSVEVPVFPVTAAIVALALFQRCSEQNGCYRTYKQDVLRVGAVADKVWEHEPGFRLLSGWPGASVALDVFMEERKHLIGSKRHVKKRARPPQSSARLEPDKADSSSATSTDSEQSDAGSDSSDAGIATDGEETQGRDWDSIEQELKNVTTLPQPGDTFSSFNTLYLAFAKILIPSMGISVTICNSADADGVLQCNRSNPSRYSSRCPFTILADHDPSTGLWRVSSSSVFKHNHGPAQRLLNDPTWRPTVRNVDARRILGMKPLAGQRFKLKKGVKSDAGSSKPAGADAVYRRGLYSLQPHYAAPPPSYSSSHLPPTFPARAPLYPPPPLPAAIPSATLAANAQSSFLAALHPSLASLAPHLSSAGIDSISSLADLALFEPSTVNAVLELVVQRSEDDRTRLVGAEKVSVVQVKMLARALREGREKGWPA